MNILVIIPIINPPEWFFNDVIGGLLSQTLMPKILLINSGNEIQQGPYEIITIDKKDFNHANTRNLALSYKADFYLFMTQDATPADKNLIANLLDSFTDNSVVVTYAKQLPYKDADAIEIFARTTNYPEYSTVKSQKDLPSMGIKTFFNSDSCAMYRGDYFGAVGGFTPGLSTNEDMDFAARAIMNEKKVAYAHEAKVYHSHNFTLKQVWQRYRQIGRFFAQNPWILDTVSQYSNAESTGVKQAIDELKYLYTHSPISIPKSILFSLTKYIAFKSSF
jgi:rhamnosyltransferase